ncbi:MAG: thiolase family protein [Proteobacteria bacterium]|nr:thiolase family protein [Pseudomonadota bacterium]
MKESYSDVVFVSAVRSPMGKFGGTLRDMPVYELGGYVIKEALSRAGLKGDELDEAIIGNCRQAGNGPNPARSAILLGGIDKKIPANTVNMACPSGMLTILYAIRSIIDGTKIVLCGGMESMSTIPYLLKNVRWEGFKMGDKVLMDGWGDSVDPIINMGMGQTAENLVEKYGLTREELDQFAVESHQKAGRAKKEGWFKEEIVPIPVKTKDKGEIIFSEDESIREDTSLDKMAKIPPAFKKGGCVTAGNSCGLTDGSAMLVAMRRDVARSLGLTPLFSVVSFAQTACENAFMGEGPGYSIPMVLEKARLSLEDIDLIEVNEAFAAQMVVNERMLNWDRSKVNITGGAIALGHPTGCSGARIVVTLYHNLKRLNKELGVAGICGAGGVTTACVIKREG